MASYLYTSLTIKFLVVIKGYKYSEKPIVLGSRIKIKAGLK